MTRFLTLDNAYPEAFAALPHSSHEEWFQQCFGTSDFMDVALRAAGHEAKTLVANFYSSLAAMIADGIKWQPDVVLSREAGRFPASFLRPQFPTAKLICTCSHRVEDSALYGFNAVFTSFPWFVDHVHSLGIKCEYLPLAFGRPVLDRVKYDGPRDIPVCFIGGLGTRTWKSGTETMEAIAAAVPDFIWHGYWQGDLSSMPPALRKAYRGEAYGKTMYELLMRSLVVVNRHGEIAQKHSNNCRVFETQGCGALLLNDCGGIPGADGIIYDTAGDAVKWIQSCIEYPDVTMRTAARARERILKEHTFEARVPRFLEVVQSI